MPNIELYENTPGNKVSIHEVINGKKVVLFGVPGAFIPGCSKVSDAILGVFRLLQKKYTTQV